MKGKRLNYNLCRSHKTWSSSKDRQWRKILTISDIQNLKDINTILKPRLRSAEIKTKNISLSIREIAVNISIDAIYIKEWNPKYICKPKKYRLLVWFRSNMRTLNEAGRKITFDKIKWNLLRLFKTRTQYHSNNWNKNGNTAMFSAVYNWRESFDTLVKTSPSLNMLEFRSTKQWQDQNGNIK